MISIKAPLVAFLVTMVSVQSFAYSVYFCKMQDVQKRLVEGIVSSELCKSVRATYDNCVGDSSSSLQELLCRQYMNKNLECVDLSQNGATVVVENCKL